jgi:methanogenic corrinoid protein MtbC1
MAHDSVFKVKNSNPEAFCIAAGQTTKSRYVVQVVVRTLNEADLRDELAAAGRTPAEIDFVIQWARDHVDDKKMVPLDKTESST